MLPCFTRLSLADQDDQASKFASGSGQGAASPSGPPKKTGPPHKKNAPASHPPPSAPHQSRQSQLFPEKPPQTVSATDTRYPGAHRAGLHAAMREHDQQRTRYGPHGPTNLETEQRSTALKEYQYKLEFKWPTKWLSKEAKELKEWLRAQGIKVVCARCRAMGENCNGSFPCECCTDVKAPCMYMFCNYTHCNPKGTLDAPPHRHTRLAD